MCLYGERVDVFGSGYVIV